MTQSAAEHAHTTSRVSPLAAILKNKSAKGKSGGLPQNVVIGVTADKVFLFG